LAYLSSQFARTGSHLTRRLRYFLVGTVVSDQFEPVSTWTVCLPFCLAEFTPLGESGGAVGLEVLSVGEAAFLVKMVRDGGVDSGEFLKASHPPEAEHRPLPSSEWQV
jgi:hypothetical protein